MQFNSLNLNARLAKNLAMQGLTKLTPIQSKSIPKALSGHDLLASASTGSGKTLAFLVPCINGLLNQTVAHFSTRCLVLTPTRELAHQILSQTHKLTKGTPLKTALILGGEDYAYQVALLRKNPDIVIATPGRFMEHQRKNQTDTQHLEVLVIDEADRMLEVGFLEDVETIATQSNPRRQTLFYSATLNNANVKQLAHKLLNKPQKVLLDTATQIPSNISQQVVLCDDIAHKQRVLSYLAAHFKGQDKQAKQLIFVNSRELTQTLADFLCQHQHKAVGLHGQLEQTERNHIIQAFRQHHFNLLVATEVAARGLDIKEIERVINFDMPHNTDDYIHRVGRTGRNGAMGSAITLVNPNESKLMQKLEQTQGVGLEKLTLKGLAAKHHKASAPTRKASHNKDNPHNKRKKPSSATALSSIKPKASSKTNSASAKPSVWGDGTAPFAKPKTDMPKPDSAN